MGVLDRFLDAIKLNDEDEDYLDEDFLDDDEDFLDDEEPEEKPRRSFMERFSSKKKSRVIEDDYEEEYGEEDGYDDDYNEEDEFEEDEPEPVVTRKSSVRKASPSPARMSKPAAKPRTAETSVRATSSYRSERASTSSKITPMRNSRRSGEGSMEVCVLRPLSMENTREIADTLMEHSTVILNLEGLDLELAQRIIDFASGACYALGGTLQKVSGYIFVLGPANVDITGDMTNLLGYETSVSAGY